MGSWLPKIIGGLTKILGGLICVVLIGGGICLLIHLNTDLKEQSVRRIVDDFKGEIEQIFTEKEQSDTNTNTVPQISPKSSLADKEIRKKMNEQEGKSEKIQRAMNACIKEIIKLPVTSNFFKYVLVLIMVLSGIIGLFMLFVWIAKGEKNREEKEKIESDRNWQIQLANATKGERNREESEEIGNDRGRQKQQADTTKSEKNS